MAQVRPSKKDEIRAIAELVSEREYVLDAGALALLHELASITVHQGTAKALVAAIRVSRSAVKNPTVIENLTRFAEWVLGDPKARQVLERGAAVNGVYEKPVKAVLRKLLGPKTASKTTVPLRPVSPATNEGAVLDLSDRHWPLHDLPELLNRLASVPEKPGPLVIRLGAFTYASALAVVAAWLLARNRIERHEIECPPEMHDYLRRVRFTPQELRKPDIIISPDEMDWSIGLTRINASIPTDQVVAKVVDIVDTFANLGAQARKAMLVLISEVVENVHRHSDAGFDGFVVANVYPKRLKMGITFVDTGIGIAASLGSAIELDYSGPLATNTDWLKAACTLYVTSKPLRHSGYGLYLLEQVVSRNRGTLALSSGTSTMLSYFGPNGRLRQDSYEHLAWKGTIVTMVLDLQRPLPLMEVYETIPPSPYVVDGGVFGD